MKIFLMIVAILFGGTAVYAGNLNKIHGADWSCKRLDSRFPDEFINKCYECEEKGEDFYQDNKPKGPDDFASGVGHCVPKGTTKTKAPAPNNTQQNRTESPQAVDPGANRKKTPAPKAVKWFSIAAVSWKDNTGVHVRTGYAGGRSSREEAESDALAQCNHSRCVIQTSWNHGCGWVAQGTGKDSNGVTAGYAVRQDKNAAFNFCKNDYHMNCKVPIGGCAA